ncbi:MAG: hypothetical protein LH478_10995 [Chitinophagaceae bacterium]|nr:hypothetical protein [Chitinophagaceae bacterium]
MKYIPIVAAFFLFACVKSKNEACPNSPQYQVLTSGAKQWLPYSNNKSLVFENGARVRDTIDLLNFYIGDDSVWTGDKCPSTRGQFIRINFYDKKSNDIIRTQVGMQDELRIFTKYTNLIFYDSKNILIDPTTNKRFDVSATFEGITFSSVLALECSATDNCPTGGITKVYFAKSKGLIAYQRNGTMWVLK